jgi:starch-binding outer membrane protein, SusD/RagB family
MIFQTRQVNGATGMQRCKALVVAALVLVGTVGCTDMLVEPRSTVTGANIFNDEGSYRAFLAKIYAGLAVTGQQGPAGSGDIQGIDEGFSHYIRLLWQLQELPTDAAVLGWGDEGIPELTTMVWGEANPFLSAMYSRVFFQVAMANEFLRETEDARLTERGVSDGLRAQIQQYRAEARFLRALSYWHGIDLFGNIPLVDEDFTIGATPPEQSTRAEIFAFIESELSAIQSELPPPGAGQYGRADQGAALMLLAHLYINAEVYVGGDRSGDALAAASSVINSGAYSLDDNYLRMFMADNDDSPELIFAVPQDGLNTQSFGGTTFLTHAAVGGNMNPADFGIDFGWWGLRVTPQVVGLFGDLNGSDARSGFFFTDGQSVEINSLPDFHQGIAAPKYQNITSTGAPGSDPGFADVDYPMFRLGDAYLLYAEAHLRGGGGSEAEALGYVNALRERSFGDDSGNISAAELTLDFILDERGRELLWEGHRRTDLIRFGVFTGDARVWAFKGGTPGGQGTPQHLDLYPIPAAELVANPNLEQNPGY